MESNELNPEKSLQIISEAIRRSRREFEKNAGTPIAINYLSGGADTTLIVSIASLITLLIPGIILNLQSKNE